MMQVLVFIFVDRDQDLDVGGLGTAGILISVKGYDELQDKGFKDCNVPQFSLYCLLKK